MEMVLVSKVSHDTTIPLWKGVRCIEQGKFFEQTLLNRLIKIQSILPCNFLRKFLEMFSEWESKKLRLVASKSDVENYIPIFERLRGLNVRVSNL